MRDIIISPQTQADIRRLCGIYERSACFCEHMCRMSKNTKLECYACLAKRILAAIEPEKEVPNAE
jgi:hypothetical protein